MNANNFKPVDSDKEVIYVISFPRSGSVWTQDILSNCLVAPKIPMYRGYSDVNVTVPGDARMEQVKPNVLVKGDDWDHIPGQEWIIKHGGKLIKPEYSKEWSTSKIVKKIRRRD